MAKINKLQLNNIGTRKNIKDVTNTLNTLIEEVNKLKNIKVKGPAGTYIKPNTSGYSINIAAAVAASGVDIRIGYVVSPMTGGGFYNCVLENDLLSANWNSSTSIFDHDTEADTVQVLNINEEASNVHLLNTGDLIVCWEKEDDDNNDRYIGFNPFGKYSFTPF